MAELPTPTPFPRLFEMTVRIAQDTHGQHTDRAFTDHVQVVFDGLLVAEQLCARDYANAVDLAAASSYVAELVRVEDMERAGVNYTRVVYRPENPTKANSSDGTEVIETEPLSTIRAQNIRETLYQIMRSDNHLVRLWKCNMPRPKIDNPNHTEKKLVNVRSIIPVTVETDVP